MRSTTVAASVLLMASYGFAGDIGYIEAFALSKDRQAALRALIPGTEDHFYYHSLHYLNTEQFDKAADLLRPWADKFGRTNRFQEIETRHALLTYDRDPKKTLEFLRTRLGVQFNHQRQASDGPPDLPTKLDPQLISRARLKADALARFSNLDGFEDIALDWLAADQLDPDRRRVLLQRMSRPDAPNLAKLVDDDLSHRNPPTFGDFAIHSQMTRAQLDDLLALRPALLNQTSFAHLYQTKLHPTADEDWRRDPAILAAYLDRLLIFVRRLDPVHNSLKAHVTYHRLALDRTLGKENKSLFIDYLKLPRQQGYMARQLNESSESQRFPANLGIDFANSTRLPPVGSDEPLVRAYLKHFLATADSPREFAAYIDSDYLKYLFAEVKIEAGVGDADRWAADLPPDLYRQIKERIDIDFAPTNRSRFASGEPVTLELAVKNVSTLIVKVFEINTTNYYRENKREVETDINLDGLVPNSEQTFNYPEPAERRVSRRFELPQLAKPGVYVVDFIGGGKSSRAVIRKGRLRALTSTGPSGVVVRVVDDTNQPVPEATLWLGGAEYKAGKDGTITVPLSSAPGRQPVVLSKGEFACLDHLDHPGEGYSLVAGIHVEREQLLAQRTATLVLRPGLYLNGVPQSVKLLDDARLQITAIDQDGISTSTDIPNVRLFEDRETTHEFRVPPRLAQLNVMLFASVKSLITGLPIQYAAGDSIAVNGFAKTGNIDDLHLAKFGTEFAVEMRGRTGEAKVDKPVSVVVKHRDFKQPVNAVLKTDARGRVVLGELADVVWVSATGSDGSTHMWPLPADRSTVRPLIHARRGDTIIVPVPVTGLALSRAEFALFELTGENVRTDRFDNLGVDNGGLAIAGLPAGDFDLHLKAQGKKVRIRVVEGQVSGGYVLGTIRHLKLPGLKPVRIASVTADADNLTVRLIDASKFARVHVFATRYVSDHTPFGDLAKVQDAGLTGVYPAHAESAYLTGRNIGDEYRYVLDRKFQKKFPGSLLDRPQLLLNPWAVRTTETGEQQARGGEMFGAVPTPAPAMPVPPTSEAAGLARNNQVAAATPYLDYLADPAALVMNLEPDKDGVVSVPRKAIGPHALIHVVAVDPLHTESRVVSLPESPTNTLDLRLKAGLDPKGHFTQQKQVSVLPAGQAFVLADAAAGRFEAYDSLPRVFALYATLSNDPRLTEFAFVLNWAKLKPEEKRAKYSEFASHELNFYLSQKDAEFFDAVVKPYLANKKDKTFLDHYLLGDELAEYAKPWRYNRLNAVERVLLSRRLPGEPAKTTRHFNDLLKLLPPNLDRERVLFETAALGRVLDRAGKAGQPGQAEMFNLQQLNEADAPSIRGTKAPKPAAPGMGMGGPGGAAGGMGGMAPGAPSAGFGADGRRQEEPGRPRSAPSTRFRDGGAKKDAEQKQVEELRKELSDKAEKAVEGGDEAKNFFAERTTTAQAPPLFRQVELTKEWAENNYYKLPITTQTAELVPVSKFWADYAGHDGKSPFLSRHFADASRNFTEMMFALAVLDLPMEAKPADAKFDAGKLTYTPVSATVAVHEEIRPVAAADGSVPVLVSQNFYKPSDRYREENGERLDKFVAGEFVAQTVYGCQIVVTNPSPSRQKLTVLVQLPVGSVPVGGGKMTRSTLLDLEPYRTLAIDYLFYFPLPGTFAQFPVHVAKNEKLVASATPVTFNVVEKPTKVDAESWEYVSQNGTPEQVLAYLTRENVSALNLDMIAFRMQDAAFFEKVMTLLIDRHVYNGTLWSYALKHGNVPAAREFLQHADQLANEVGGPIESVLVRYDPVTRHSYEHLEYKPLVNARAHALGTRRQIVNDRVSGQYHHFLKLLSYRRDLTDDDRLATAYYLLLQDRIDEAAEQFGKVNAEKVSTHVQYDYFAAHLGLVTDDLKLSRSLAMKHANHPVDRWKKLFAEVAGVLDEVDGKAPAGADPKDRTQKQTELAATAPGFEFVVENKQIQLTWQNLQSVRVNYYLMDVELLFSRNPFVQQTAGRFAAIKPNRSAEIALPAGQTKTSVPLPKDLEGKNVLVEITAAGKTRAVPYYANAMTVTLVENFGQVRVLAAGTGKPLAKVYVKTYVRTADGQVKFHKDGYTDVRGRFDYASVSTPERGQAVRYAVLVLSEEAGAVIREAEPPQR